MEKKDWQAFEAKLSRGLTIAEAAAEAGVDLAEAEAYCQTLLDEPNLAPIALRAVAFKAMATALDRLTHFATEATDAAVGAAAARDLAKLALEAHKLAGSAKTPPPKAPKDLFDAAKNVGPWKLKDAGT